MKLVFQIAGGILLAPLLAVAAVAGLVMFAAYPIGALFVAAIIVVAWRLGPIRR